METIDDIDRKILTILQENARTTNAEIARQIGLAPSGTLERIRKLEQRNVITGYHLGLNAGKLGFTVTAFMFVRSDDPVGDIKTARLLSEIPEVEEVHHIAGEDCYLVKLRCADNESLGRLMRESIGSIKTVRSSRTSVVLETIKEGGRIPIQQGHESI